jgi:pimeloyl-ACP methyl ester carboxylesterase
MPFVGHQGIQIHYEVSGSGDPLLLLHGLGGSTEDWALQVAAFASHYQVITLDVRGHGRSAKPRGPYQVEDFTADARAVLHQVAVSPVHVVGLSMGGMIALQLGLDAPALVKTLVIVNSGPEVRPNNLRDRLLLWQRALLTRAVSMDTWGRILADRLFPEAHQAEAREALRTRWARNDKPAYLASFQAIRRWSVAARLGQIRLPMLVVAAELDYTPVEVHRAWAARVPNARVVVVAGSRHATPADRPEEFNRVLEEFLSGECHDAPSPKQRSVVDRK